MHEITSGEPQDAFMQMAGNLAPINAQHFGHFGVGTAIAQPLSERQNRSER